MGKPTKEELDNFGLEEETCSHCALYGWHKMFSEWKVNEGWCDAKVVLGVVRADMPKCKYFVKRGDIR